MCPSEVLSITRKRVSVGALRRLGVVLLVAVAVLSATGTSAGAMPADPGGPTSGPATSSVKGDDAGLHAPARQMPAGGPQASGAGAPLGEPANGFRGRDADGDALDAVLPRDAAPQVAITVGADWSSTSATPPYFDWSGTLPVFSGDSFQFVGCGTVDVTDAFVRGDRFRIYDNGVAIGETSVPSPGGGGSTQNPETAFNDPTYSSGSFGVGNGAHDITIEVFAGMTGGGGFIRVRPCADLSVNIESPTCNPHGTLGVKDAATDGLTQPSGVVIAGEEIIYTVGVYNSGPGTAMDTTVTVTLPIGVGYVADTDSCTSDDGSPEILTCSLGDIAQYDDVQFEIKTRVDAGLVRLDPDGTIVATVTASVESLNHDPNLENNVDDCSCFIQDSADLSILKFSKPDDLVRGDFTYTIYVDNTGPSWARGVYITDDMISNDDFVVDQIIDDPLRNDFCSVVDATPPQTGQIIRCELREPLEPFGAMGGTGRWRIQVVAHTTYLFEGPNIDIDNTVRVYTGAMHVPNVVEWENGTPDPDLSNNVAVDTISILTTADLELTKQSRPVTGSWGDPVTAGENIRYTLRITNTGYYQGGSEALNVRLYDNLPAEVDLIGYSISNGDCVAGTPGDPGDPLRCVVNELDVGESQTLTIFARVRPDVAINPALPCDAPAPYCRGRIFNDAWVEWDGFDPDPDNNLASDSTDVLFEADLAAFKSDVPDTVVAGENVTYNIVVNNNGPSMARAVFLSDQLPPSLEFVSAEVLNRPWASCTTTALNQVLCDLGDIMPGAPPLGQVQVLIAARVKPGTAAGSLTNTARVFTFQTYDPDTTNNEDTEQTAVIERATVTIDKRAVSSSTTPPGVDHEGTITAVGGGTLTYEFTVKNAGPSVAYDVTVTDPLNQDLTYLYSTSAVCTAGPSVTCALGDLDPGETRTFEIIVAVHEGSGSGGAATLTNTATLAWATSDGDPAGTATDTEVVPVSYLSDLRVRKFGKPDGEVRAGELLTYTIVVDNLGPSVAPTVTVIDELRASGEFDIMGLLPDATGSYNGDAVCTIDAPTSDAPINPIVTNLPVGVPYVPGAEPIAPGVNQRATITCVLEQQVGPPMGVFGPPGDGTGRWIIEVAVMTRDGVSITNCADVSSAATDPDLSNNSACTAHEITEVADLGVTKKMAAGVVGPIDCEGTTVLQEDQVTAGQQLEWTITVVNNGPSAAENVLLWDRLPAGITVTGYSVVDEDGNIIGDCTTGTPGDPLDRMICGLDTLATGTAPVYINVTATVDPALPDGTVLENDATVSSDMFDDNNSDNYTSQLTTVNTIADLELRKSPVGPFPWLAGEVRTYEYDIVNHGPSWARDVKLVDSLPMEAVFERAYTMVENRAGGVPLPCTVASDNTLVCPLGDIPLTGDFIDGKSPMAVFVDVFLKTDVTDGAIITNYAQLFTDTLDPCADNSFSTVDQEVNSTADLWITKDSEPQKVYAGEQKKYIIRVGNDGPSDALDVVVTDTLPPEVTYEIDTDHCTVVGTDPVTGGQVLACAIGDLKPGEEVTFWIWVRVDACVPAGTEILNTACVPTDPGINTTLGDPDPENNCDDAKNLVLAKSDLKVTKFGKMDGEVRAGEVLTYTVFVDNLGPSCAADVGVKDLMQSSEVFDLIDISSDRAARCEGTPGPASYDAPAEAWGSIPGAPPAFQVLAARGGVANINQRLQLDCVLTEGDDPQTPDVNEAQLETLEADGFPNPGRWILTMRARARQTQDVNNIATVTTSAFEPDWSNNQAQVEHAITDVADISVTKTATGEEQQSSQPGLMFNNAIFGQVFPTAPNYFSSTRVTAGRRILYTLTVTNNGPSNAENVVLSDRLPAGVLMYQGSLTAPAGVNCETGTPGEPLDRLTCGFGLMTPGTSRQISFQVVTDASLDAGTVLENDAYVTSDIFDNTNRNNYAFAQNTVLAAADMRAYKTSMGEVVTYDPVLRRWVVTDIGGQVTPGQVLRYQVTVQNNGPSDSREVTVEDTLPPTSQVEYLYADGADCRPDDVQANVLYCALGDMYAGERKTFDIYVRVNSAATTLAQNCALVLSGPSNTTPPGPPPQPPTGGPTETLTWDPYPADNQACAGVTLVPIVDVFIAKEDVPAEARLNMAFEPDQALAGDEHRYQITFGNNGPSRALNVTITDALDYKQPGILGETFLRCEAIDPDDQVTCSFTAPNTVTVTQYRHGNQTILPGGLNPGETFSFYLVTKVDSGYVLDGTDFLAQNCATITTTSSDGLVTNNTDCELTEIIAEADLAITKVDDAAGFLACDPVGREGTVNYVLTVTNNGPSDAAEVYVVDWLPALGLVLDPAQVDVTVVGGAGQLVEVRDDGRITVRVGYDPNNSGTRQYGRVNVGTTVTIQIQAKVAKTALCGYILTNRAYVETRRNDAKWPVAAEPFPGIGGGPRTPTLDPNLENNEATQGTTVECPAITVNKTVSFDGTCPGKDLPSVWNKTAQPVTFCFEITNSGTTWLDEIYVEDKITSRTRPDPTIIYTDTIESGVDPLLPLAPGEKVWRQVTIPHLLLDTLWDCGKVWDTVTVTANPVNSGRTDLPCLPDVTGTDTALIEVPCAGVDWRIQLPVLNGAGCESWIQIQNVGDRDTKAMLVYWGAMGFCPPQASGPLKAECSGLLAPGSAWSFATGQIPAGAESAVVYSLSAERVEAQPGTWIPFADVVCNQFFYDVVGDAYDWQLFDAAYLQGGTYKGSDFGKYQGEPLAATVNRSCPDPVDPNVKVNAAYTGISSDMEGARDPRYSGYMYYAPLIFAEQNGLNSIIHIQNSGDECTSLEIWFKSQDNCLRSILGDVLTLAPGETVHFNPNTVVGPGWLGSAWIRGSQPLGVVVDALGANHFTSYNGTTADVWDLDWSYGNQINFAPLTYSEYQGWDTALQVQNLSGTTAAKVKVYFLDRSGDVITTLVDWICPRGTQTFFLPLIDNIPGNWVGSARIESQEWLTPGGPRVDPPRIATVVLLEKWADPQRTTRREAVAYNAQTESLLYDWQIGAGKGGTASGSAVFAVPLFAKDYRGITTELAITNLVPKPGFTDFAIFVFDQNGMIDYVCQKLNEKQVEYIDLATWGWIDPRFMGSAVISATFWEHDVFSGSGEFERNLVGLGGVVVERVGGKLGQPDVPGDESKAFEAFPVYDHFATSESPNCPGVPGR